MDVCDYCGGACEPETCPGRDTLRFKLDEFRRQIEALERTGEPEAAVLRAELDAHEARIEARTAAAVKRHFAS